MIFFNTKQIKEILISSGFSKVGITSFDIAKNNLKSTNNKEQIPNNAKSIIVGLIPYFSDKIKGQNISSYAVCKDYHLIAKEFLDKSINALKELFPNNSFVGFCDNSPFDEVQIAVKSGLGVKGSNNLLITKEFGSYVFISEIVSDLELIIKNQYCDCEKCFACVKACPNGALSLKKDKVIFKKENCISYISQKKGALSQKEQLSIKKSNLIWGCDICIDTCPHNNNLKPCGLGLENDLLYVLKEDDIKNLSNSEFLQKYKQRAFSWRGKETIFRNIKILD